MIPPNPSERTRPSSGPITFLGQQSQTRDQREGLWMGVHQQQQQQIKRPNSGHLFQINEEPGYGKQGCVARKR